MVSPTLSEAAPFGFRAVDGGASDVLFVYEDKPLPYNPMQTLSTPYTGHELVPRAR
jgi:hypothetical protein